MVAPALPSPESRVRAPDFLVEKHRVAVPAVRREREVRDDADLRPAEAAVQRLGRGPLARVEHQQREAVRRSSGFQISHQCPGQPPAARPSMHQELRDVSPMGLIRSPGGMQLHGPDDAGRVARSQDDRPRAGAGDRAAPPVPRLIPRQPGHETDRGVPVDHVDEQVGELLEVSVRERCRERLNRDWSFIVIVRSAELSPASESALQTPPTLTIFAVVINCPMCRWVCSAAWNNRPRTVLGSPARPTPRASVSVASSVVRNCASARSTAASNSASSPATI